MGMQLEAPEIFALLQQQQAILEQLKEIDGASVTEALEDPEHPYSAALERLTDVGLTLRGLIQSHELSSAAQIRFTQSIEELLSHPRLAFGKIHIMHTPTPPPRSWGEDWFDCGYEWDGRLLDNRAVVLVLHPRLFEIAKERWADVPRFSFSTVPREDGGSYDDERQELLQRHGIPADSSTWMWAYEALHFASDGLKKLGIEFRLCDYVEWSSSDDLPNLHTGAVCSGLKLHAEANFGHRIGGDPSLKRIEGCVIWRTEQRTYLAPLWEYLSWSGNTYAELRVYADALADIGKGIDRALMMYDADFDPEADSRMRLTASDIFRAGEALTNLRIKLELGDVVDKGVKAGIAAKDRAKRGGIKSAVARDARREALLGALETVAQRNQDFAGMANVLLPIAVNEAVASDPALWAQGRGQADEYLGEIRRGEAGEDMQRRYQALFPR